MNTEDLIHALVADGTRPVVPIERTLLRAFGAAFILAALSLFVRHLRVDIVPAFSTPPFVFKVVLLLLLTGTCLVAFMDAARPVAAPGRRRALMLAPVLLAGGVMIELLTVPHQAWSAHLLGHNAAGCLTFIPLISLGPLACLLAALRSGAPRHATLAGATAGLLAGAVGATVYALTCPDDNPLFIAAWYSGALVIVTAMSAAIGTRLLRW
jgi:hypothetical protein